MPDPNFGMISPMGQNCMRYLGAPVEQLKVPEAAATHVVRESLTLTGASFAQPLAGAFTGTRTQLISGLDGKTFVFTASGLVAGRTAGLEGGGWAHQRP